MLRSERAELPRDFTDKTVTPHEINTLRMKMERSELELAQKLALRRNREFRSMNNI